MSLKALVEIQLHFDTFRNIDLFYQGLYYIKIRLLYKNNANFDVVQPYWNFQTSRQEERNLKMKRAGADNHNLITSCIQDDSATFVTKTFLIRYCEEEVEINDVVLFRAELEV